MARLSPETVAERIRDAGWVVDLLDGPPRLRATRRGEKLTVTWNDDGEFVRARHWDDGIEDTDYHALGMVTGVLTTARATPRGLPWGPEATDVEVLEAVRGRVVKWRNSISGMPEEGEVPKGGLNVKVAYTSAGRILSFTDVRGFGFRSVRLSAIEGVS